MTPALSITLKIDYKTDTEHTYIHTLSFTEAASPGVLIIYLISVFLLQQCVCYTPARSCKHSYNLSDIDFVFSLV